MDNIKSAIGIPCCNDSQGGSILIAIIAAMLLMGVLSAGVISFTSTNYIQTVNTKQGDSAYYLAESGLRYAASQYKKVENENANFDASDVSADDEKADYLENTLDNQTLTLPDNKGTIKIDVYPYWFVFAERGGTVTLKLPGQVPEDFAMPTSGRLKLGNEIDSPTYLDYTSGSVSATGVFTCKQFSSGDVDPADYERKEAYPVLQVSYTQSNVTDLVLPCTTPGMFPSRNGRIQVGSDYYTYTRTVFDSDNNQLMLSGLSSAVTVSAGDSVVLKKFIVLESEGTVGSGNATNTKLITNSIPLGDSKEEGKPIDIKLDEESDFNKYFDKANNEGVLVRALDTAGGGSTIFTNMQSLSSRTDAGEDNQYMQGSFTFKEGTLDDSWESEYLLDYDMQVKLSSYNSLMYAGLGLEFRKKKVTKVNSVNLYRGFGISFLKFYSPALKFKNGSQELKDGDLIYYYGKAANKSGGGGHGGHGGKGGKGGAWTCNGTEQFLAEAQVDGDPVLTSGSWDTNNAAGIVRLKNSSLNVYSQGEHDCYAESDIKIYYNGNQVALLDQALHGTQGYNDYIPDSIKPAGMGSWLTKEYYPPNAFPSYNDTNNEGDILVLVLWQQKVESGVQYRRILAYKDMTHDIYSKGEQDSADGRIVNDETCLLLRVREDYMDTTKINKINIFYGDSSRIVHYSTRQKNKYKYDILNNRMAYWGGFKLPDQSEPSSGWSALWPPRNLTYWASSFNQFDYFSHIEKPDTDDIPNGASIKDPDKFQWDYIASTTGIIESWDGSGNAIFTLDDAGTITISDFTTPDSGTYGACEIGLGGFFYSSEGVGFSDFSIRVLDPGYTYGAFISSVQS